MKTHCHPCSDRAAFCKHNGAINAISSTSALTAALPLHPTCLYQATFSYSIIVNSFPMASNLDTRIAAALSDLANNPKMKFRALRPSIDLQHFRDELEQLLPTSRRALHYVPVGTAFCCHNAGKRRDYNDSCRRDRPACNQVQILSTIRERPRPGEEANWGENDKARRY